jgi:hypothetical protein
MYRIGPSVRHREEHVSWDGLILPKDDPWWDSHFPPNGWGCKCYTRAVTEARKKQYETNGIPTAPGLDGTGGGNVPAKTQPPPVKYKTYFNERKGTVEQVPAGVDPAFNWNQGKAGNKAVMQKLENSKQNYNKLAAKSPEPKPRTVEDNLADLDIKEVNLANLNPETKQDIYECIKGVYSKLSGVQGTVKGIVINNRLKKAYAQCTLNNGTIELAGVLYRDIPKLKMSYEQDLKYRFHPAGTDYRSILTHEIGHALTGKIAIKQGLTFREFSDRLEDEVLKELGMSAKDIGAKLSLYGCKNSLEFIAEAFAEYMDSKTPRSIALKVGEKLKSYLGGIK